MQGYYWKSDESGMKRMKESLLELTRDSKKLGPLSFDDQKRLFEFHSEIDKAIMEAIPGKELPKKTADDSTKIEESKPSNEAPAEAFAVKEQIPSPSDANLASATISSSSKKKKRKESSELSLKKKAK